MAVNETIVTGRKFRKLIDETTKLWQRISFWTKASDVEFDDGENAETKFTNILKIVDDLKQGFQDGVNKIYDKLSELGFTPNTNSPDDVNEAIQGIYDERYKLGLTDGVTGNIPDNAKIKYTYHNHSSCTPIYKTTDCHWQGTDDHPARYSKCPMCGSKVWVDRFQEVSPYYKFSCRNDNGGIKTLAGWSCGKTTSTIEKIEVNFE
ncbi:MAG: hypothetical protein HDR71_13290 [Lachnospiraceae bacterium]|nr:hypothetical protein [Lachnospiraceae bacterium]